jgi:hypothetical protein
MADRAILDRLATTTTSADVPRSRGPGPYGPLLSLLRLSPYTAAAYLA